MRRWLLLLLLALPGCASDTPNLFTLEARAGRVMGRAPRVVVVRTVGVPRYLERLEIMRTAGQDRFVASDKDWWAEPLRVMLRRVMVDDLAQRLPASDILAGDGSIAARHDVEVLIDLQRFEGSGQAPGQVSLVGYVAFEAAGRPRTMERLRIDVPVQGPAMRDHVGAMSTALGQAADLIAARLAQ